MINENRESFLSLSILLIVQDYGYILLGSLGPDGKPLIILPQRIYKGDRGKSIFQTVEDEVEAANIFIFFKDTPLPL